MYLEHHNALINSSRRTLYGDFTTVAPICRVRQKYFIINHNLLYESLLHTVKSVLKVNLSLGREGCQHAVTDEFLCMVAGCALGTDVCHWMFKTKSTWFKVNKIPL